MGKRVVLKLGTPAEDGKLTVRLQWGEGEDLSGLMEGSLSAGVRLEDLYDKFDKWREYWREYYQDFGSRKLQKEKPPETESYRRENEEKKRRCSLLGSEVEASFRNWISEIGYITAQLPEFSSAEAVRVNIQAEDLRLQRLPWHLWELVKCHSQGEISLSPVAEDGWKRGNAGIFRDKIRILGILGAQAGLNVEKDRKLLQEIVGDEAELVFIPQPSRQQMYEYLWEENGWDMLYFAGHSEMTGDTGKIKINQSEYLQMAELKEALRGAMTLGLKLAIFNSCDGLGLARELADLHIPQTIVMRELIVDRVAQQFLQHFFTAFKKEGKSVGAAVRQTQEILKDQEKLYPCASWLPVVFQCGAETSLTWESLRGTLAASDWRGCTGVMLRVAANQRLRNNLLARGEGLGYEVEEVYIPPTLRREGEGSQSQVFQLEEFFEQLLDREGSPDGQRRRIAVIGEPGCGKTRLLYKFGDWILDNSSDDLLFWVSLADLQGKTLAKYLREVWFPGAMQKVRLPSATAGDLVKLFDSRPVWLLLDGVDEFGSGSENSLRAIVRQLNDWVGRANVVMTCRLNVWDGNDGATKEFQVYRHLDFEDGSDQTPDQVEQFIDRWFMGKQGQAERLREALKSGNWRIRDLAKNPLRLSLLCRTWWRRESLPETKAGLYEQFVADIYEWKGRVFLSEEEKEKLPGLNGALARLALRGMEQGKSRFRLRYKLILKVMDKSLFELACKLGWLNRVGVAAKKPSEQVYAFYHLTFQEFFAARAIDDGTFFFNHVAQDMQQGTYRIFEQEWEEVFLLWLGLKDVVKAQKEELIDELVRFDAGCDDLERARAYFLAGAGILEFKDCRSKDAILDQLVKWGGFGYFNENKQEWTKDEILEHLVAWKRLGYFNEDKQEWALYRKSMVEISKDLLVEIDPERARVLRYHKMQTIAQIMETIEDENNKVFRELSSVFRRELRLVEELDTGNPTASAALAQIVHMNLDQYSLENAIKRLGKIAPGNPIAIESLVNLINDIQNQLNGKMVEILEVIESGNTIAIVRMIQRIRSEYDRMSAAKMFWEVNESNETEIKSIINKKDLNIQDENTLIHAASSLEKKLDFNEKAKSIYDIICNDEKYIITAAAESLGKIDPGNEIAIAALVHIIETSIKEYNIEKAAIILSEIDKEKTIAIATLVKLIQNSLAEHNPIYNLNTFNWRLKSLIKKLDEIDSENQYINIVLLQLFNEYFDIYYTAFRERYFQSADDRTGEETFDLQRYRDIKKNFENFLTQNKKNSIDFLVKIIRNNPDNIKVELVVKSLNIIGEENKEKTIAVLIEVINNDRYDTSILEEAVESLGQVGKGNNTAIAALVDLIQNNENQYLVLEAVKSLSQIDPGNKVAIETLVQIIQNNEDKKIIYPASLLAELDPGNPAAIKGLVKSIQTTQDEDILEQAAKSLVKVDPGNPAIIEPLIKIIKSTDKGYNLEEIVNVIEESDPGNPIVIEALVQRIETTQQEEFLKRTAKILAKIDPGNSRAIKVLVKLIQTTESKDYFWEIVQAFKKRGPVNPAIIEALVQRIETTQDRGILEEAAICLAEIDPENKITIESLFKAIPTTKTQDDFGDALYFIAKIGRGDETAFIALLDLIQTTEYDEIIGEAVQILKNVMEPNMRPVLVSALKDFEEDPVIKNDLDRYEAYSDLISDCSQNMPMADFYQAWHGEKFSLMNFYTFTEQHEKAIKLCQGKVKLAHKFGNEDDRAKALVELGNAYYSSGQSVIEANKYYYRSLRIAQKNKNPNLEVKILINLGNVNFYLRKYSQAIQYYQEALNIAEKIGDRQLIYAVMNNLGTVYSELKQFTQAIKYFKQAIKIAKSLGDSEKEYVILSLLINVYLRTGNFNIVKINLYYINKIYYRSYKKICERFYNTIHVYGSSVEDTFKKELSRMIKKDMIWEKFPVDLCRNIYKFVSIVGIFIAVPQVIILLVSMLMWMACRWFMQLWMAYQRFMQWWRKRS